MAIGGGLKGLAAGAVLGGAAGILGGLFGRAQAHRQNEERRRADYALAQQEIERVRTQMRPCVLVEKLPGDCVTYEETIAGDAYLRTPPAITFADHGARRIVSVQLLDADTIDRSYRLPGSPVL